MTGLAGWRPAGEPVALRGDDDGDGAAAAVTGPRLAANPMRLASTMTTTAVTATQV
jgi:hypothetical protein